MVAAGCGGGGGGGGGGIIVCSRTPGSLLGYWSQGRRTWRPPPPGGAAAVAEEDGLELRLRPLERCCCCGRETGSAEWSYAEMGVLTRPVGKYCKVKVKRLPN